MSYFILISLGKKAPFFLTFFKNWTWISLIFSKIFFHLMDFYSFMISFLKLSLGWIYSILSIILKWKLRSLIWDFFLHFLIVQFCKLSFQGPPTTFFIFAQTDTQCFHFHSIQIPSVFSLSFFLDSNIYRFPRVLLLKF